MVSASGATETAPMVTCANAFDVDRAGVIGLPAPGTEVKLVPNDGKLELRVRGPNVTPGYWKRPDLTRAAFDEEGFYRIGDARPLRRPDDPAKGIEFDGRIAEDFKLLSGVLGACRCAARAHRRCGAARWCRTSSSPASTATKSASSSSPTRPAAAGFAPTCRPEAPLEQVLADARCASCLQAGLATVK